MPKPEGIQLNELALFAGAGGGILGGSLCGCRTVCAVEKEAYPRAVLLQRQNDGVLPPFPIWDDVCTFDGKPWRGKIDIITGGFPCQDISAAGKGKGLAGERSGLWSEMARIIGEIEPRYVLVENSPMLTGRGLDVVLMDLAEMGYDAQWGVLGADDAGAPHRRKRIWIVAMAHTDSIREKRDKSEHWQRRGLEQDGKSNVADTGKKGLQGSEQSGALRNERDGQEAHGPIAERCCSWWDNDPADIPDTDSNGRGDEKGNATEPSSNGKENWILKRNNNGPIKSRLGRVAHGVAYRVDRLKAVGNGQVPAVVALALTRYL